MSKRSPKLYFHDILIAINDIESFIQHVSYEVFLSDKKTINAVTRSLEVIGEAASHMPEDIRTKYPDVPWEKMTSAQQSTP